MTFFFFFLIAGRHQHCVYFACARQIFTVHKFIIIQLPSYAFIVSMMLHYCVSKYESPCLERK